MPSITLGRAARCQGLALALSLASALLTTTATLAAETAGRVQVAQAPPAQPQAGASAKSKPRPAEPAATNEGTLQRRVEQLEEQLVDMQVTIGTLESLARSGGGGGRGSNGGGASLGASEAARIEGMETQMRALTSEVQRLTNQVRQLGGASDRGDVGGTRPGYADSGAPRAAPAETTSVRSSFGSTTVTTGGTGGGDPIGSLINGQPQRSAAPQVNGRDTQVAALPPATSSGSAKQDYETAYGHLLKQDYGAAEMAFEDFLQRYPSDALAGNAQYWLGETHFVRGSFKAAAGAFLKGYQNYGKGNKAPDSLLKLAMSLERLGQKDAACSSFGELVTKFPDAAEHVKARASGEQKRLGCR